MTEIATRDLTESEARRLTDRIRSRVSELLPMIVEAFERRAWLALGHDSWDDYCDSELRGIRLPIGERAEAVGELRNAGMSTRAIGSALGVSDGTVRNDLRSGSGAQNYAPAEAVTGTDGKQYAPTQPPTDPLPPEIAEQIDQRIAEKTAPREDQPESQPAEATDGSPDPHTVRSAAAVGADPTPAPTATNPVEEFIKNDPVIQAHDYAVAFAKALSKSGVLLDFDANKIGKTVSDESFFALQVHVDCLNRFFEKTRKARFGGPRLVKGDTA